MFHSFPNTFYIVDNNLSSKLEMDGKNMGEFDKNFAGMMKSLDGNIAPPAKAGGGSVSKE